MIVILYIMTVCDSRPIIYFKICLNLSKSVVIIPGWLPVQREVYIDHDLEATPLEIKTNSTDWSLEKVRLRFFSAQEEMAGGVSFYFRSPAQYYVYHCNDHFINLPSNLPTTTNKVWKITLIKTSDVRLIIHCDFVEVVNILMSDSSCAKSAWSSYWTRDVEKIWFRSTDRSSDYYRAEPGD